MSKGGQRPTTMPSGGKGGAQPNLPEYAKSYYQENSLPMEQISIASPEEYKAMRERQQNLPPRPGNQVPAGSSMGGKGGNANARKAALGFQQDPSTADPSWRPSEPTIPQQPAMPQPVSQVVGVKVGKTHQLLIHHGDQWNQLTSATWDI